MTMVQVWNQIKFIKIINRNFFQYGINWYIPIERKWDRDKKNQEKVLEEKEKTGYIYLPGSQYRGAEGHLKLRSCLHDAVINSAPSIGKYTNKN